MSAPIRNECRDEEAEYCEYLTHVLITQDVDDREPMVAWVVPSHAAWVEAREAIRAYVEATVGVEDFSMSHIGPPITGAEAKMSAEADLASLEEE